MTVDKHNTINQSDISPLPIEVNRVILPLDYSYAKTGDIVITPGQYVKKNQYITRNIKNNEMSIALHAPISGYVSPIINSLVINPLEINPHTNLEELYKSKQVKAIEISKFINNSTTTISKNEQHTLSTKDNVTSREFSDQSEQNKISKTELLDIASQYGIIGLGGAGFPSAKKLSNSKIDTLVVNAVECESPIAVDNGLIINYCHEVIDSIAFLVKILKVDNIVFALKETMSEAYNVIASELQKEEFTHLRKKLVLYKVADQYPNGYSKTLINLVTNHNIPSDKHSIDYGIVCFNVSTLHALWQAAQNKIPLVERIVTITGDIDKPGNYLIPIGTPITTILKAFSIDLSLVKSKDKTLTIKIGGDYMGYEIFNSNKSNHIEHYYMLNNTGIDKTTQAIQIEYKAYPEGCDNNKNFKKSIKVTLKSLLNKLSYSEQVKPCIRCNLCEDACPINLKPQQIYWFSKNSLQPNKDMLESYHIQQCMECGLCDQVCPSNIPLAAKFKHIKSKLKRTAYENNVSACSKARNDLHNNRDELKKSLKNKVLDNKNKKTLLASVLNKAKKTQERNVAPLAAYESNHQIDLNTN